MPPAPAPPFDVLALLPAAPLPPLPACTVPASSGFTPGEEPAALPMTGCEWLLGSSLHAATNTNAKLAHNHTRRLHHIGQLMRLRAGTVVLDSTNRKWDLTNSK
jgi:hypothetical protein